MLQWQPAPQGHRLPWPGKLVSVGGHELFVRTAGEPDAEPAVFVHGLGGSSTDWTDLVGLLSGRLRACAVDLPGFGRTQPPESFRYALDEHAGVVTGLIREHAHARPVHLFGSSLGGAVAIRVAAEHLDLVRTLTLVSPALPTLRPHRDNVWVGASALLGLGARRAAGMLGLTAEAVLKDAMDRLFHNAGKVPARRAEEALQELEETWANDWSDQAFVGSARGLISEYLSAHLVGGRRSLWRQAAAVEAPTLLVWGRHDRLVSPALAGRAAAVFPCGRLLMLEGVGHAAHMEQPLAVARAFTDLLDHPPRFDTSGEAGSDAEAHKPVRPAASPNRGRAALQQRGLG